MTEDSHESVRVGSELALPSLHIDVDTAERSQVLNQLSSLWTMKEKHIHSQNN